MNTKLQQVEDFIYDDEIQKVLSNINNRLMDFNILEITGMGNQEIKHSNILGWLFDDSEHNLEHQILDNFLKKVIEENINKELQSYIYLSPKKKDITIYREKNNIDVLIIDEANKVVITIENKVYASERIEGEDDGQLVKYETIINKNYDNSYKKYFIFLTIDLEEPSKGNEYWMKASHFMITGVIEDMLKVKKDISTKTKIILESYIDLLKRNGIVADETLEELCKKIWDIKHYREAFEIIINNKPSKSNEIFNYINDFGNINIETDKSYSGVRNIHMKFNQGSPLVYRFIYNTKGKGLNYVVVTKDEDLEYSSLTINGQVLDIHPKYKTKPDTQYGYNILSKYAGYVVADEEINESKIYQLLQCFKDYDESYLAN